MADLEELERLARSFFEGPQSTKTGKEAYRELGEQFGAWRKAAQPDVILALLEERKRLRTALEKIIEWTRTEARDRYGDAEKAEKWACVETARAALEGEKP